ncbi:hypothetical protein GCM10010916_28160 [Paenibacillus abyssi]|uniref:Uncharacterized protein n=1 Tax=Paenibacillus abyssi TaxID=1340531 RepID=A0A917D5H3_9BACL|nr:hypothetical protein GCM10010916_28160 [Paenibacillus abyssi]
MFYISHFIFLENIESYLKQCAKTRAIQSLQEKEIIKKINELRRSLDSGADTGKER